MMRTHVIILAQGEQRRLPDLKIPKQLLTLSHGGRSIPILTRTIQQLWKLSPLESAVSAVSTVGDGYVVVCNGELASYVTEAITGARVVSLPTPSGNSSIKGIARCLHLDPTVVSDWGGVHSQSASIVRTAQLVPAYFVPRTIDRVVVLLGDVIYSWNCLERLLAGDNVWRFAISHDLSPGGGEVWGLSWDTARGSAPMRAALIRALEKHPPFAEYQPGQMRNWLYELEPGLKTRTPSAIFHEDGGWATISLATGGSVVYVGDDQPGGSVFAINDYTMDVDTPKDLPLLDKVAPLAHADDLAHGVTW